MIESCIERTVRLFHKISIEYEEHAYYVPSPRGFHNKFIDYRGNHVW